MRSIDQVGGLDTHKVNKDNSPNPTKARNDQLAIEPPKNIQSTILQSPPPLKIIGIPVLRGNIYIIP